MSTVIVWLPEERLYGLLIHRGAYTSTVMIDKPDGAEYAEIENDEIVILSDEEDNE